MMHCVAMKSSRYRVEREIRPHVYLGVSDDSSAAPALLELIPWQSDPASAWKSLERADECERHIDGMLCIALLDPAGSQPQPPARTSGTWQGEVGARTDSSAFIAGPGLRAPEHMLRDVTESIRTSHSPQSSGTPLVGETLAGWFARKRKLLAFVGGVGLVVAIIGVLVIPRTPNIASAEVTPSATATLTPLVETDSAVATEGDLSVTINQMLEGPPDDALTARLVTILELPPGERVVVSERSRNGDVVLVRVAAFNIQGAVKQASVELQRDVTGWRLRDVQPV